MTLSNECQLDSPLLPDLGLLKEKNRSSISLISGIK